MIHRTVDFAKRQHLEDSALIFAVLGVLRGSNCIDPALCLCVFVVNLIGVCGFRSLIPPVGEARITVAAGSAFPPYKEARSRRKWDISLLQAYWCSAAPVRRQMRQSSSGTAPSFR